MYSISAHGMMIADKVRTDAYAQALRQAVTPDSVVLDVGTGTGIFAMLACRFGAKRVYAVEPDNSIQVAREIAAANGLADRIVFIQDLSTRVTLPERADVIVSDLRGRLPWFELHIPSVIDARERLLAPGGTLIPLRDTLWAAVVGAPELYKRVAAWDDNRYGLEMHHARNMVANSGQSGRPRPEQLLVEQQCWMELDYTSVKSPNVSAEISWTAAREGTAHGFIVWFDTLLAEQVGFSNAPGEPELIYGNAFFPWLRPVSLRAGDKISINLRADLVGGEYVWQWGTEVFDGENAEKRKAEFKQSTFFSTPLSLSSIRKRAANYVPALNDEGRIDQLILSLMDGQMSLGDIASQASELFPQRFTDQRDALAYVAELSQKYSR